MKIRLGERYDFTPSAFEGEQCGKLPQQRQKARALVGRVVWIHPQRRFFTVEANCNGTIIRESFAFPQNS